VAVLFGDLRGLHALSAQLAPTTWRRCSAEYLSAMVDCVFRHAGTLDKFIGDAVMAQWGAPHGGDDDADRAMRAALDMLDSLERLNARWRREGRATVQMGIGLSYGEVFAGNIGSERRLGVHR
jgi:adenylate cyclase